MEYRIHHSPSAGCLKINAVLAKSATVQVLQCPSPSSKVHGHYVCIRTTSTLGSSAFFTFHLNTNHPAVSPACCHRMINPPNRSPKPKSPRSLPFRQVLTSYHSEHSDIAGISHLSRLILITLIFKLPLLPLARSFS